MHIDGLGNCELSCVLFFPPQVLRRPDFFGQYGRVIKVVLNRNYIPAGEGRVAASSAYVTYGHPQSAIDCIRACDGFVLDGRVIHCSFGTSKYCHLWLRGFPCPNPDCMYLHAVGARDDSFTKEDMQAAGRQTFHDITHPPAWRGEPGTGPDAPPPQPSSTAAQRRTVLPSVAERYWGVGVAKGCGLVSVPAATRPPLQAPGALLACSVAWRCICDGFVLWLCACRACPIVQSCIRTDGIVCCYVCTYRSGRG